MSCDLGECPDCGGPLRENYRGKLVCGHCLGVAKVKQVKADRVALRKRHDDAMQRAE